MALEKDCLEDWIESIRRDEILNRIDGQTEDSVLQFFFKAGNLFVNYDDHLISVIRDVRQLLALGVLVPPEIKKSSDIVQKFYHKSIALKQIAHFYNTIDSQMLTFQQPMMLGLAVQFEKLIKEPGKKDENYLSHLQDTADKLTSQNRHLRRLHDSILNLIQSLMSTDLIKNQMKWKETVDSIRSMILSVQEHGISMDSTISWRNHIDVQIYKVFQYQYKLGLENLHSNLSEIKVDLVYKNQMLQFRPPFEEIRAKYYREIKKFINLPTGFKTLGDSTIFANLINSCSSSMSNVYSRSEKLFDDLKRVIDLFEEWVVLGAVDLEKIVIENIKSIAEWELNLKLLKQKGKEAESIPSVIRVDCISISTSGLRTAIDDQLQSLYDSIIAAIRTSISAKLSKVEEFIAKATDIVSLKAQSMEDITLAAQKQNELIAEKSFLTSDYDAAEADNKFLRTISGVGIDATLIQSQWNKLEIILESHEMMMTEQLDVLRNAFSGRISTFNSDLEKFSARWNQLKPKVDTLDSLNEALTSLDFIRDREVEFFELEKVGRQLVADSQVFAIPTPSFQVLIDIKNDIRLFREMWAVCESFVADFNVLWEEDWVSFRSKGFVLEDLVCKWMENFKKRKVDGMSVLIKRQLDSYSKVLPFLKYLNGDVWAAEHWSQFFHIVGMQSGITIATLRVKHIMEASENIINNSEDIIALNARAQGEVSIREAVQELDLWGASQRFSLITYQTGLGESTFLIKEWKEVLSQIGDHQCLIQSIKDSLYFKRFADRANTWEAKLSLLENGLKNLNVIQRKWLYLEPLFSRGSLPNEHARFTKIDSSYKEIMTQVSRNTLVVSLADIPGINQLLTDLIEQLDRCQKALNDFMEQKRDRFGRFYFIGDDDLLEILGQSKNPQVIQTHLKKLFGGVHSVKFDEKMAHIVSMCSAHGEEVILNNPVKIEESVEVWLDRFDFEMRETLKNLLTSSLIKMDFLKLPQQIVDLLSAIRFTEQVESILNKKGDLRDLEVSLISQLEQYTNFKCSDETADGAVTQMKLKSLILLTVHLISVVKELIKSRTSSVSDWLWQKQLRFYMIHGIECKIRMNDAEFNYSYEYQGNYSRLVHTPLTDKCFLTLTQAMYAGFGGNPLGPAGTGMF